MSLRRCLATLVPVATAAAIAWPGTAGATLPGLNGRIAFVRPGSGIWEVNPDGSGLVELSSPSHRWSGCDSEPAFSPNGSWLIFQGCNPPRHMTNVGRMTFAGLKRRTIVTSASGRVSPQTPSFSPSGRRITFAAGSNRPHIYIASSAGRGARRLGTIGYAPDWSSRGRIAFTVPENTKQWCNSTELDDIAVIRPDGWHRHQLTYDYGSYDPDWAPNGKHIAYARDFTVGPGDYTTARTTMDCLHVHKAQGPYGPEIVVAAANGAGAKRLTYSGGAHPSWSPDGRLIAFERAGYVWVMHANGKHQRRLVRGTQPAWQPLASGR
jgi:Tol biopolymer transport system component